jgi:Uma2 family endonuclease
VFGITKCDTLNFSISFIFVKNPSMTAATATATKPGTFMGGSTSSQPKRISWNEFERKYLSREDEYKYEWVHGIVEKTKRTMNPYQIFLQRNLTEFFYRLKFEGKVTGQLIAEPDLFFLSDLHRRPDMAWLTDEQIDKLIQPGMVEVPAFVIEVVSKNDAGESLEKKMDEYREAGVKVVWQLFPAAKTVHVYSGKNMRQMKVCKLGDSCSAGPVLLGFDMDVDTIFKTV